MGVKHWSAKLTPDQREALERLPTSVRSVADLRDAHLAYARAFLAAARPLGTRLGASWPDDLHEAAAAHLREVLGVDDPYPGC
jgi:hypothetical protein